MQIKTSKRIILTEDEVNDAIKEYIINRLKKRMGLTPVEFQEYIERISSQKIDYDWEWDSENNSDYAVVVIPGANFEKV